MNLPQPSGLIQVRVCPELSLTNVVKHAGGAARAEPTLAPTAVASSKFVRRSPSVPGAGHSCCGSGSAHRPGVEVLRAVATPPNAEIAAELSITYTTAKTTSATCSPCSRSATAPSWSYLPTRMASASLAARESQLAHVGTQPLMDGGPDCRRRNPGWNKQRIFLGLAPIAAVTR